MSRGDDSSYRVVSEALRRRVAMVGERKSGEKRMEEVRILLGG